MKKFRIVPSRYGYQLLEVKTRRDYIIFNFYSEREHEEYISSGSLGELEELARHLCTEPKEISCSQSQ